MCTNSVLQGPVGHSVARRSMEQRMGVERVFSLRRRTISNLQGRTGSGESGNGLPDHIVEAMAQVRALRKSGDTRSRTCGVKFMILLNS